MVTVVFLNEKNCWNISVNRREKERMKVPLRGFPVWLEEACPECMGKKNMKW